MTSNGYVESAQHCKIPVHWRAISATNIGRKARRGGTVRRAGVAIWELEWISSTSTVTNGAIAAKAAVFSSETSRDTWRMISLQTLLCKLPPLPLRVPAQAMVTKMMPSTGAEQLQR
jgi:hypothetical protein